MQAHSQNRKVTSYYLRIGERGSPVSPHTFFLLRGRNEQWNCELGQAPCVQGFSLLATIISVFHNYRNQNPGFVHQ